MKRDRSLLLRYLGIGERERREYPKFINYLIINFGSSSYSLSLSPKLVNNQLREVS